MEQTNQTSRPLRLLGFCKKCRKPGFGFLLNGVGPFLCYKCGEEIAKKKQEQEAGTLTGTVYPGVYYFSFTTSNDTSTTTETGNSDQNPK